MPTESSENHPEQTLPRILNYCFSPSYSPPRENQTVVIVVDGMMGHIPTVLSCLTVHDAEQLCDRFNARLGLSPGGMARFRRKAQVPGNTAALNPLLQWCICRCLRVPAFF